MNTFCDLNCYLLVYVAEFHIWVSEIHTRIRKADFTEQEVPWGLPAPKREPVALQAMELSLSPSCRDQSQHEPLADIWVTCVIASGIDTAMSRSQSERRKRTEQMPAVLFADFPGSVIRPDLDGLLWMGRDHTYFKEPFWKWLRDECLLMRRQMWQAEDVAGWGCSSVGRVFAWHTHTAPSFISSAV